jgi:uncharacterized membrane protein HdeD (DUF308 family)
MAGGPGILDDAPMLRRLRDLLGRRDLAPVERRRGGRLRGAVLLVLGLVVCAAPFAWLTAMPIVVGIALFVEGAIEGWAALRATTPAARRGAVAASLVSVTTGVVCLAFPALLLGVAVLAIGVLVLVDGVQRLWTAAHALGRRGAPAEAAGAAMLVLFGVSVLVQWPFAGATAVGLALGARLFAGGWALLAAGDPDGGPMETVLGVPKDHRFGAAVWSRVEDEERTRRGIDAHWMWVLLVVFFAIHVGRMQSSWTFVGLLSPLGAVAGDAAAAVLVGLGIVLPIRTVGRRLLRPLEQRAWRSAEGWPADGPTRLRDRLCGAWLVHRTRSSVRLARAAASPIGAIVHGLRSGLPIVAVVVATHPVWGFSWYFNSENWVTGAWEKFTELRVDDWRDAIVGAARSTTDAQHPFAVAPSTLGPATEDFTFLVIGDPGEGDASQWSLVHRILELAARPESAFLVVSSDVVYPAGEMKDYEHNFFLPFAGTRKPIYAIPGNHDWYDALDAFTAVFFAPEAAHAALAARRTEDLGLTSTTRTRAESLVADAARLRAAYGVETGAQRAPFFELATDRFALLAIDTGILRTLGEEQWRWLEDALERHRGKFLVAITGHPFAAAGTMQTTDGEFLRLRETLARGNARIVMGGDTHDFELYREPGAAADGGDILHVVNGGGGAYLSIGTALMKPEDATIPDRAVYPSREALVAKLDAETPFWKRPIWIWTKRFAAWPSTPETLSAVFDFNHAPFFQSFVEVRVEGSRNRVVLVPHGVQGPLRWRDLDRFGSIAPDGVRDDDVVAIEVAW